MSLLFKRLFYPGFNFGVRARESIHKFFLSEPNSHTLDVGCGNGYFASLAARRGSNVLSIGFDAAQVRRCNDFKRYMNLGASHVDFKVMDVKNLDSMPERFDQILFLEVVEHLDDDFGAIVKIAEKLKPNGIIHITTPDIRWGPYVGTLDRQATGGHCRLGYSAERLETLVRHAGLDVAFQKKLGGRGLLLVPLQETVGRWLGNSFIGEGLTFLLAYPFYRLLNLMPLNDGQRMFHYVIARKTSVRQPDL